MYTTFDIPRVFIEIHQNVHIDADAECRICRVPFKKSSLVFHERRFHPEVERKERIIKAVQRHISDEVSAHVTEYLFYATQPGFLCSLLNPSLTH